MYRESLDIILQGLTTGKVTHHGKFFAFDDFPTELEPFQKPHPPLWYGVHSTQSAERAARAAMNLISLDTADETRPFSDTYRSVWREAHGAAKKPGRIGLGRFVVVADTDQAALSLARRAYPVWHRSFTHLFVKHGHWPSHPRPPEFDQLHAQGKGVAGSPATVAAFLAGEMERSGADYLVGQLAFGDLSPAETMRSLDLFVGEVMPALRAGAAMPRASAAAPAGR
jgi:alkanesulfonate monooxygenase SsuD/methylene tetrahydromethanopterin reductase-like flavin-dependent oxidoreductase (luciferase family)